MDLVKQMTVGPPTTRLLRNVADAAGSAMTTAAAAATPKETGEVAERWRTLPTVEISFGLDRAFESGTENTHYVARFLEHGTSPHEISPERAKALGLPEGPKGGAHHPGIRARHMTAVAATTVEAGFDALAARHLHRWAEDIESNAAKHEGITRT